MTRTVLGIFTDRDDASNAIDAIEDLGLNPKDISIVMKDKSEGKEFAESTGTSVAEGAVTGATTGAALGGLAGLLIGVGAIAIPGVGGLLIGGPLAAALGLTGAAATTISGAATGALAGGLLGALMGLGIPEEEARIYETSIQEGGILVAVPTTERYYDEVRDILEDNGATQVRSISHADSIRADSVEDDELDIDPAYTAHDQPSYAHIGAKGGKTRKRLRKN